MVLSDILEGQIHLNSWSTSLSLRLWNSPFEIPWFTYPGPMMWGWVHSVGWPYFAVALKIPLSWRLFQRYVANLCSGNTFGRILQVGSIQSSLATWDLPPSNQSSFTHSSQSMLIYSEKFQREMLVECYCYISHFLILYVTNKKQPIAHSPIKYYTIWWLAFAVTNN